MHAEAGFVGLGAARVLQQQVYVHQLAKLLVFLGVDVRKLAAYGALGELVHVAP